MNRAPWFPAPPLAYCETCGRLFYTLIGKFCDVPTCRGYIHHIERRRASHSQASPE
jgi:hypothetical protein